MHLLGQWLRSLDHRLADWCMQAGGFAGCTVGALAMGVVPGAFVTRPRFGLLCSMAPPFPRSLKETVPCTLQQHSTVVSPFAEL